MSAAPALTPFQIGLLIVNTLTLIVLAVTAYLIYRQTSKFIDWNRRKAAHDLVFEASIGQLRELRDSLESEINPWDTSESYDINDPQLDQDEHSALDALLNFFENTCYLVDHDVLAESIIYENLGALTVTYWRWADPYIQDQREKYDPELWIGIDDYVEKWRRRLEERDSQE